MIHLPEQCHRGLKDQPQKWYVTGAAGFIGSHLCTALLENNQQVVGIDNFSTGNRENIDRISESLKAEQKKSFDFLEGDIRNPKFLSESMKECHIVLHQAALGSVPRSLKDPVETNSVNVEGFLQVLRAAESIGISRVVYASSSSVYGDDPNEQKREEETGKPLSPYAVSKWTNELYATVFSQVSKVTPVGLRYFNVFGPAQNPEGAYAAVIPRWIGEMLQKKNSIIYGDGETSRDFSYIDNIVQANILAALTPAEDVSGKVFNIAAGGNTTLNDLYQKIQGILLEEQESFEQKPPQYDPFRPGDVRHSCADIGLAKNILGYDPLVGVDEGLRKTISWYLKF